MRNQRPNFRSISQKKTPLPPSKISLLSENPLLLPQQYLSLSLTLLALHSLSLLIPLLRFPCRPKVRVRVSSSNHRSKKARVWSLSMVQLVNPWKLWRHADPTTKRSPPPTVVPMVKMEIEEPLEEDNWFVNKRLRNPNNLQQLSPPDEAAFVIAAREFGFEFYVKTQTSIALHEFDPDTGRKVNSLIFDKLPKDVQGFEAMTKCHIDKYSEAGLRIVVLAYRVLREEEYKIWYDEFSLAKSALSADHNAMVESAGEKFERDLILLGAAVEDILQKRASHESIARQLREAQSQLSQGRYSPCALIIDGSSLAFALSSNLEESFLDVAVNCASVICCRTSPKQKELELHEK